MTDDLLTYYNRELLNIRRAAAAFAAENPRIAGRLRLSEDAVEDPHVDRLVEAFAFLTARVRQKLDDDFSELTDAMLGILYPHYTHPLPAMAILQMAPPPEADAAARVPRHTLLDSEPVDGERCRFRSAFDVTLHPVNVSNAALAGRPIHAPDVALGANAAACLRLTLEATTPEGEFADIAPDTLRFFLRGQPQLVYPLHELLLNDVVGAAFAAGANDANPVVLAGPVFTAVGFESDETLLPCPATSHRGHLLLTEYFAFPEKFLFVDLAIPKHERLRGKGRTLDVFLYLGRPRAELERTLTATAFALNCTPVVNLFEQAAEPITADHTTSEYRVVADSRRPGALEVHSIKQVTASDGHGNRKPVQPIYSTAHATRTANMDTSGTAWWLARRQTIGDGDAIADSVTLALVDPNFTPSTAADMILSVDTLCFNRNLPERLPFGGGHPQLYLVDPSPAVANARLITAPTSAVRADYSHSGRWRLISQLSLNHLSLVSDGGLDTLKEMLLLNDLRDSAETRLLVDGIVDLASRPGTARLHSVGHDAFCRGIDIALTFDETYFSGNSIYLAASVLEYFFGMYAGVNSFIRLTARVEGQTGALKTWPARAGDRWIV